MEEQLGMGPEKPQIQKETIPFAHRMKSKITISLLKSMTTTRVRIYHKYDNLVYIVAINFKSVFKEPKATE